MKIKKILLVVGLLSTVFFSSCGSSSPLDESKIIAESVLEAICQAGPIATKYFKEAVKSGSDMTLRDGLILETDLNVILQSTSDRAEGIASFMEKRTPKFTGE